MTNYFHPSSRHQQMGQDFMKQNINKWFAIQLRNELESGKELENIMIKFILSTMKLFYAVW